MINMSEYAKRRKELMKFVAPSSIVIVPSANEIFRNGDTHYSFRQNSDFYYLTGFNEPEAIAVLVPRNKNIDYILFNRVRDKTREIWDGPRAGQEGAKEIYGADESYPFEDFAAKLPELLVDCETIYYPVGKNPALDHLITSSINLLRAKVRGGVRSPLAIVDVAQLLSEMRLIKSKAEIAVMQKAADISVAAHERAMQACKPGMYEYQLEAELMQEFLNQGARYTAYGSIVGAGKNSCVLHYVANNEKINNGDMVLIDAGCEFENYASDITRTFPANGKFSSEQRAIYDLVLEAQLAAIKEVKPGAAFTKPQDVVVKIITQGLVDLGILKGRVSDLIEQKAYFDFYMHRSGHWLGLDVHDVGTYGVGDKWRNLESGMALTVEPGIYISESIKGVHKRWHNIGVRIEDDVVVTDSGNHVLTKKLVKKANDVEALMK